MSGRTVTITSPDKVFFTTRGDTKLDLVNYYLAMEASVMRQMGDRPVLLQRFPNGAHGSNFFQKRIPDGAPEWLHTTVVQTPNGTDVARAGDRRPRPPRCGPSTSAASGSTPGRCGLPTWSTATSCASTSTPVPGTTYPDGAGGRGRDQAAARRHRHHRLHQDLRQSRPARLRATAADARQRRRPQRRGRRCPRARAASSRR